MGRQPNPWDPPDGVPMVTPEAFSAAIRALGGAGMSAPGGPRMCAGCGVRSRREYVLPGPGPEGLPVEWCGADVCLDAIRKAAKLQPVQRDPRDPRPWRRNDAADSLRYALLDALLGASNVFGSYRRAYDPGYVSDHGGRPWPPELAPPWSDGGPVHLAKPGPVNLAPHLDDRADGVVLDLFRVTAGEVWRVERWLAERHQVWVAG